MSNKKENKGYTPSTKYTSSSKKKAAKKDEKNVNKETKPEDEKASKPAEKVSDGAKTNELSETVEPSGNSEK